MKYVHTAAFLHVVITIIVALAIGKSLLDEWMRNRATERAIKRAVDKVLGV